MTGTAIAIFDDQAELVFKQCIATSTKTGTDLQRQAHIRDTIHRIVEDYTQLAEQVVVFLEGHALGSRTGKAFTRAELIGVLKHDLAGSGHTVYVFPPTSLKKWLTGKGRHPGQGKRPIMDAVFSRWSFHTTNDNIADAYAAGRYGICYIAGRSGLSVECVYRGDGYSIRG